MEKSSLSEQEEGKIIIVGAGGWKNHHYRGSRSAKSILSGRGEGKIIITVFFYQEEGMWTKASNAYV
jgi:hypothetical protein